MNWKKIPESQGFIQRIGEWAIRQHTFMPRMIDLEVSRICNLNCPACMRRASSSLAQKGGEKFCLLERFKEIHRQIPTIGTLNFMGDGEPLMNPELNDIIHYASLNNIYTVITTNATLVDKKYIEHWKENKVYKIHASVDSIGKTYEEMRIGADWEITYKNLRLLGKSGIPLCINVLLTKKNIDGMVEMVKLAKEVGAKEITFLMPICAYGDDKEIRPEDNEKNRGLFKEAKEICRKVGINWIFPLKINPTFRRLNFPFIRPQVSIEGDIYACCYSLGRGKNWVFGHCIEIKDGTYNMGNIFKEGFRNIWYGSPYKELREVYKKSEVKKGTVITREDYLRRVLEIEKRNDRFAHCEICPVRWGVTCS